MNINICTTCNKYLAISPEGLCNICDEKALEKRKSYEQKSKKASDTSTNRKT